MPNKSYEKGRRFEYRVKYFLEKEGWVVIRAAGSKPIDLVALKKGMVLLIECKRGGYVPRDQRELQEELARRAGAVYIVVTPRSFGKFREKIMKSGLIKN